MNTSPLEDEDGARLGHRGWASVTRCSMNASAQKKRVSVVGGWKRWWSNLTEPKDPKPRFKKVK